MNKLIIKISLVLLPVMITAVAFEFIARKIPTSYSTKLSNFNTKKKHLEIIVMGSSHSNFGINPQYFERSAYNLSNTSQCLYQDYLLLSKYLPECKNIKMVIIPISYFTLQSDLAKSSEAWRCAYYSLYMGIQSDTSLSKYDLRNFSALFLWDGPFEIIQSMRNTKTMNINQYGFQVATKSKKNINEEINEITGKERVEFHDKFMDFNLVAFNISVLDRIASELNKKNVKMVFVTTPVYKTYQQHISKRNYELMINTIESISNKYSANYFNYFYDTRFQLVDYSDNDHLNEEGAKKFSIILKDEIIDKLM